ncbi:unnamed protein product [Trichogramma brassicae]|uniref:Uncharacterized protein n=1 Tax=Trichogramma brassicae TaxID=86971 RepID=A0A6H5HWD5_9HYME|nr:unnamed protein product [Trichogramma brassicae]
MNRFDNNLVNLRVFLDEYSNTRRRFRADSPGQRQMKSFSKRRNTQAVTSSFATTALIYYRIHRVLARFPRRLTRSKYSATFPRRLTRSKANEIIFKTKKYSGRHFEFCHDCVNLLSHTSSTRRGFRADSPGQRAVCCVVTHCWHLLLSWTSSFRARCLVPSCECGSRFCRRWQVPQFALSATSCECGSRFRRYPVSLRSGEVFAICKAMCSEQNRKRLNSSFTKGFIRFFFLALSFPRSGGNPSRHLEHRVMRGLAEGATKLYGATISSECFRYENEIPSRLRPRTPRPILLNAASICAGETGSNSNCDSSSELGVSVMFCSSSSEQRGCTLLMDE